MFEAIAAQCDMFRISSVMASKQFMIASRYHLAFFCLAIKFWARVFPRLHLSFTCYPSKKIGEFRFQSILLTQLYFPSERSRSCRRRWTYPAVYPSHKSTHGLLRDQNTSYDREWVHCERLILPKYRDIERRSSHCLWDQWMHQGMWIGILLDCSYRCKLLRIFLCLLRKLSQDTSRVFIFPHTSRRVSRFFSYSSCSVTYLYLPHCAYCRFCATFTISQISLHKMGEFCLSATRSLRPSQSFPPRQVRS